MAASALNIAALTRGFSVPAWQYQLLQRMMILRGIRLKMVIIRPVARQEEPSTLLNHALRLLKVIDRLGRNVSCDALQPQPLRNLCHQADCYLLDDAHCAAVYAERAIDVLLNLENIAVLPDWLLSHSRYGVWSSFIGSPDSGIDSWTGLSQHVRREDTLSAGVVVQTAVAASARTPTQAQPIFLTTNSVSQIFLHRSVEPALWKMAGMLPRLLSQLYESDDPDQWLLQRKQRYASFFSKAEPTLKENAVPSGTLLLKFLLHSVAAKCAALWEKLAIREQWVLLYGEYNQQNGVQPKALQYLKPPTDKFWADPQLVEWGEQRFVFFEEWVDQQRKGRIVYIEWGKNNASPIVIPVLEEAFHLSYPHIFYFNHAYYMIPESAEDRSIRLYRCTRFPDSWEFVHKLMDEVEAFDATLHEYQGRWWLFVNIRDHACSSSDDLLYLYSASSPLSQQWHSHPCNPIVSDVSCARSAGKLLQIRGKHYRPSQNCAGSYGRGLNLNQIIKWNAEEYQERIVRRYNPDGASGFYGMHTFSILGDSMLSDGLLKVKRWNNNTWLPGKNKK